MAFFRHKNPLGPYLAETSYTRSDRVPFDGYCFLILTARGPTRMAGRSVWHELREGSRPQDL
jgi:hypothetical protein